jgi:hypothetical protein
LTKQVEELDLLKQLLREKKFMSIPLRAPTIEGLVHYLTKNAEKASCFRASKRPQESPFIVLADA